MTKPFMRCCFGFTLIELLVVIAVIGILASLSLPALTGAKGKAQRAVCLNNSRQINLGISMYCDDSRGETPVDKASLGKATDVAEFGLVSYFSYRRLIQSFVGLKGDPSPKDLLFVCPADTFHYSLEMPSLASTYVSTSQHEDPQTEYSSYGFNGGISNVFTIYTNTIGLGSQRLISIAHPSKTVLEMEVPALFPYSWHERGNASCFGAVTFNNGAVLFDDAKNVLRNCKLITWSTWVPLWSEFIIPFSMKRIPLNL
jgi:prepilin-type N-terminal cleavage/methylation domain-containing protein